MIEDTNKEKARKQFDDITKSLDIKHTFSFDEAWEFIKYKREQKLTTREVKTLPDIVGFRNSIVKAEVKMRELPECLVGDAVDKVNPLKHSFADGCYVREIFNPKGELLITKIHKMSHPFFLMKGDMSIMTETGVKRVKAPYHGITKVGTKRIIYAHEDCIFVTVHVTKETDLKKIEDEVIAKDFKEIDEIEAKNFIDIVSEKKEE